MTDSQILRLRVTVRGAVQGVGFRPFVYRLATELGCAGWVLNSAEGVFIEVEAVKGRLNEFLVRLERDRPPRASIQGLESVFLDPVGYAGFEIRESSGGEKTAVILPDVATCADCLREVLDPRDRRYRYPFTNCTNCGPRFSIVEALPYDRPNTTMKRFTMCEACQREYDDPSNRRFHAQPNACPVCGPRLEYWDPEGRVLATHEDALQRTVEAVRAGRIVAVKGLGGFHLVVDAQQEDAVQRLRRAKRREEKPFALMYPSIERIEADCMVSDLERRLLRSPEAPIVLLERRPDDTLIAPSVAPGNPRLGVLLPYTPLHHLLLGDLGVPVVATSGNLSDEPICTDEREALERLGGLADFFLVHNRPIARHVDDSIARIVVGREQVLRRARGYAPLPIRLPRPMAPTLAVGGHLKNTIAIAVGDQGFTSQHIGDLETGPALEAFREVIACLGRVYEWRPEAVTCDMHPEYLSTKYAAELGISVIPVQHHYAHILGCMAENEIEPPVLGVSWDGVGFGPDGTVWGGEFLHVTEEGFARVGHLRTFPLPGGDKAVKEPRRTALGLLYELLGDEVFEREDLAPLQAFTSEERAVLRTMLNKGINSPRTSSAGRLFDAVASLINLRQIIRFEGQAAMELEFALPAAHSDESYPFELHEHVDAGKAGTFVVDWKELIGEVLEVIAPGGACGHRASDITAQVVARFHNTLADMICAVAERIGAERVVLSGGCFQNVYLTEQAVRRLERAGFRPYWHQRIPPNDGGIALGQLVAAARAQGASSPHHGL